jgi:hypothetical protein
VVSWLAKKVDTTVNPIGQKEHRTIKAVGIAKMGLRRLTAEVKTIAAAY